MDERLDEIMNRMPTVRRAIFSYLAKRLGRFVETRVLANYVYHGVRDEDVPIEPINAVTTNIHFIRTRDLLGESYEILNKRGAGYALRHKPKTMKEILNETKIRAIQEALYAEGFNVYAAARRLRIDRATIYRHLAHSPNTFGGGRGRSSRNRARWSRPTPHTRQPEL